MERYELLNGVRWVLSRSDGRKKEYITNSENGEHWVAVVYDVDALGARKNYEAIVDGKTIFSIL